MDRGIMKLLKRRTSVPAYEVIEAEDISTGVAKRKRVYVTISPDDLGGAGAVAVDAIQKAIKGGVNVAFVFIYTDAAEAGHTSAPIRARYIRKGVKGAPTMPWAGSHGTDIVQLRKGTVEIARDQGGMTV